MFFFDSQNSWLKTIKIVILLLASSFIFTACSDAEDKIIQSNTTTEYYTPKYIFYFIGDGLATPQINLTESALADEHFKKSRSGNISLGNLNLRKLKTTGMATTHAEDRYITGSAAAATALATGEKTTIGTISKTGDHTQNIQTMAEMAKKKGLKVGIISSVSIDHATPACYYAHAKSRGEYNNIASQMALSNFDYFAGGYAKGNFDKYLTASDAVEITSAMKKAGYTITTNRTELEAIQSGTKSWAYTGYDGSGALFYELDRPQNHISLAEFTQRGIELLDNDKGFFMMIEGGKIDWACHANDAVSAVKDVIAFDDALGKAIDFYNKHPEETLIVLTGDHECGGLTIGYAETGYSSVFNILKHQKLSYQAFTSKVKNWKNENDFTFEKAMDSLKCYFGLGDSTLNKALKLSKYEKERLQNAFNATLNGESAYGEEETFLQYGGYYDPLTVTATHILNNMAGIDWASYSHTAVPVPVLALGQGQYEFSGYYDNTDIAKKIIKIAKLK